MIVFLRLLIFISASVLLAGCAGGPPKPYTIGGKDVHSLVLYSPTGAKTDKIELPPGYYYPGFHNDGFGIGAGSKYWMVYMHPEGLGKKGWIAGWGRVAGGIQIDFDPRPQNPRVFYFDNGGNILPLPPSFQYELIRRDTIKAPDGTANVARQTQAEVIGTVLRNRPVILPR